VRGGRWVCRTRRAVLRGSRVSETSACTCVNVDQRTGPMRRCQTHKSGAQAGGNPPAPLTRSPSLGRFAGSLQSKGTAPPQKGRVPVADQDQFRAALSELVNAVQVSALLAARLQRSLSEDARQLARIRY
jgi:hypothetical protein